MIQICLCKCVTGSEAHLEVSRVCKDLNLRMGFRMGWEVLGGWWQVICDAAAASTQTHPIQGVRLQPHPIL